MKQATKLLTALNERDPVAFELLNHHFYATIAKVARQYFSNPSDIESIVHDIFLKIWDSPAKIAHARSITAYIVAITRNFCLDLLEQEQTNHRFMLAFSETIPETTNGIASNTQWEPEIAVLQELHHLIGKLPELQRNVLRLSFIHNKPISDIARSLGKSPNNIRNAKSKGLERLREIMTKKSQYINYEEIIWPLLMLAMVLFAGN